MTDAGTPPCERKQFWLPLESNPEMLNSFAARLGSPGTFLFHDVFGIDPELLAMVPRPCVAVTLLFPGDEMKTATAAQLDKLKAANYAPDEGIFFIRQLIGNACGTIAAMHALCNNVEVAVGPETPLARFVAANKDVTPEARGTNLGEAEFVSVASEASAQGGQTAAPNLGDDVNHHFICFVAHKGSVYELDGRKPYPINHGPVGDDLLASVAEVCEREFFAHVPDGAFNLMALSPSAD